MIKIIDKWKYFDIKNESEFVFHLSLVPYSYLGCWKDAKDVGHPRALKSAEGGSNFLDGHYLYRENPITKCFKTAKSWGHKIFALQDGGECFTDEPGLSLDVDNPWVGNHEYYGNSPNWSQDGEGGPMANAVYEIKGYYIFVV